MKYLAEIEPTCRLVADEFPPLNTKLWFITEYGTGWAGIWYKGCEAVAWSPLPKLTDEQKQRLKDIKKAACNQRTAT